VDADQSTPPDALVTGMAILTSGWDAVIGSRRVLGARYVEPQPMVRRLGSRVFNVAASTLVGRISDTQCGMKLFRTEAVRDVFAAAHLSGFAFDVEILARATATGLKIMEMPVEWSDSEGSTLRPVRDGINAFTELYRVHRLLRSSR
jgi:dolichyl-phosphate beta-glucosyltransferase